jgi:hypothetical protein
MLKTIEPNQLAVVQQAENRVAVALQSRKILEMQKSEALTQMLNIISITYFETGQKTDDKMLAVLAKTTYEEVKEYFKWLRIGEMKVAFANGTRGEYGDYFGINIKTFHGWIKAFQTSEIRKAELQKKNQQEEPPVVIDRNKAASDYWRTVLRIFEAVRSGENPAIPFAYTMIKKLWNEGLIYFDAATGAEYVAEAKREIKQEKESFGRPLSKKESVKLLSMAAMVAAIESDDLTEQQDRMIKARAAEIAIMKHFALCDEKHLRDTIQKIIDRK